MNSPFKILALDGGGLRGIFTVGCLAELHRAIGPAFVEGFDLLVGTSTGGVICLGLASGLSPDELVSFYVQRGPEIFQRPRPLPRRMFRPKYNRTALDELLQRTFGDLRMNDFRIPVCITAHELVEGTTRVWKDDHAPGLRGGGDHLVWKVAAATTAAPTYFAPVQIGAQDSHIDGGVWANNPAMVGITEAVRYFDRALPDVRMLSVGTTSRVLRVPSHRSVERIGLLGWGKKTFDLLQGTVSMASHRQVALLLGGHYLRLDSEAAEKIRMDDFESCLPLLERGEQRARETIDDVRELLQL